MLVVSTHASDKIPSGLPAAEYRAVDGIEHSRGGTHENLAIRESITARINHMSDVVASTVQDSDSPAQLREVSNEEIKNRAVELRAMLIPQTDSDLKVADLPFGTTSSSVQSTAASVSPWAPPDAMTDVVIYVSPDEVRVAECEQAQFDREVTIANDFIEAKKEEDAANDTQAMVEFCSRNVGDLPPSVVPVTSENIRLLQAKAEIQDEDDEMEDTPDDIGGMALPVDYVPEAETSGSGPAAAADVPTAPPAAPIKPPVEPPPLPPPTAAARQYVADVVARAAAQGAAMDAAQGNDASKTEPLSRCLLPKCPKIPSLSRSMRR